MEISRGDHTCLKNLEMPGNCLKNVGELLDVNFMFGATPVFNINVMEHDAFYVAQCIALLYCHYCYISLLYC